MGGMRPPVHFYISEFISQVSRRGGEFTEEEFTSYLLKKVGTTKVDEFRNAKDWLAAMVELGVFKVVKPGVYSLEGKRSYGLFGRK